MFPRAAALALALFCATAARAHPEIADALTRLSAQIAATPDDAALYLTRGDLYARHAEWTLAEANYLRAAELAPALPGLARSRGALALATGHAAEAHAHLERAIAATPADPTALILRARARAQLHQRPAALADFAVALRYLPEPPADLFLEFAALHDSPATALLALDAALTRIGPVVTLHLRALDLEISLGRTEAALARLTVLATVTERHEPWLKRRGDLLAAAGRPAEARAAYTAAQAAIAALPTWLAQSPDTARLSAELTRLTATPL